MFSVIITKCSDVIPSCSDSVYHHCTVRGSYYAKSDPFGTVIGLYGLYRHRENVMNIYTPLDFIFDVMQRCVYIKENDWSVLAGLLWVLCST